MGCLLRSRLKLKHDSKTQENNDKNKRDKLTKEISTIHCRLEELIINLSILFVVYFQRFSILGLWLFSFLSVN